MARSGVAAFQGRANTVHFGLTYSSIRHLLFLLALLVGLSKTSLSSRKRHEKLQRIIAAIEHNT
jgi:hypothetical protein